MQILTGRAGCLRIHRPVFTDNTREAGMTHPPRTPPEDCGPVCLRCAVTRPYWWRGGPCASVRKPALELRPPGAHRHPSLCGSLPGPTPAWGRSGQGPAQTPRTLSRRPRPRAV